MNVILHLSGSCYIINNVSCPKLTGTCLDLSKINKYQYKTTPSASGVVLYARNNFDIQGNLPAVCIIMYMESVSLQRASKIIRTNVNREEVARYYLKSELPNIIPAAADNKAVISAIERSVDQLDTENLWRLLEAISFTYRVNGMFRAITNESRDWHEITLPISAITLMGTKPHINDIVYSDRIKQNPHKFAAYLQEYFHKYPYDDPENLNEFRPRNQKIRQATVVTIEEKNEIRILDGTHRLTAQAVAGVKTVRVYSAVPNRKPSKSMIGDSTFVLLRQLYSRYTHPKQRAAILETTALLARASTDGRNAVETYWVEHPRSEKIQSVGKSILSMIRQK